MRTPRTQLGRILATGLLAGLLGLAGCTDNPPPPTPTRPPAALIPSQPGGLGDIAQGATSETGLVLQFLETSAAAIAAGPGSFQVTLTDHAGLPDTVAFTGTPSVGGPGSLAAIAAFAAPNVLTISIVDSDSFNIEQMTISGLGIRASPTAAIGAINAIVNGCAGSLIGCTTTNVLASPGNVVAVP
jgi:hypothetical protein